MSFRRDAYVYCGVDLHKRFHMAVVVDSYGEPVGKPLKFENSVSGFAAWVAKVQQQAGGLGVIFGLEDVHGLGRGQAQYLLAAGYPVKFANAYLTKTERDEVNKTDRHDALAIAKVTAKQILRLPDANLDPLQWALLSTVTYRKGLVAEQTRVKTRLHYLLLQAWPGWEEFFSEPFESKTALAFWEMYPSAGYMQVVTVANLAAFLREQSHYALGQARAEQILGSIPANHVEQPYQRERDALICQSIRQLRHLAEQLAEVRTNLARLVGETDYRLTEVPGIDVVMAAELIALVGDVLRFRTEAKFLAYTGIAPVTLGSGGHESRLKSQFGRRELSALFHRIASTQLVVHKKTGVPRNPKAKEYYEKHLGDQAGLPRAQRDRKRMKKALQDLTLFRHSCIVAPLLYVLTAISGCSASVKPTAGSDTSAPPDQVGVPSEVSSQTPEPESTPGQAAQPVCNAVQAGSPAVPAVGPYVDLLKLKPTELEERLGRPTSVKQDGSLTQWRYEELGLVFGLE